MRKFLSLLAFALGVVAVHSCPVAVPIESERNVIVLDAPKMDMVDIIKLSCVNAQVDYVISPIDDSWCGILAIKNDTTAELPSNEFKHYMWGKPIARHGMKYSRYESRPPNNLTHGVFVYQRLC
jgi:hypothetical protein